MSDLRRVALVTGGARGIGRATCSALLDHGWTVLSGDLALPVPGPGHRQGLHPVELDVTDDRSVAAAFHSAIDEHGRLDLLVNNAGVHGRGPIETLPMESWTSVLEVNLHGVLRCTQAAGRLMLEQGGGCIVNVTSIAGVRGVPERVAYAASKAAVVAITQTAAVEWATAGIRVNAVGPGFVNTELMQHLIEEGTIEIAPVLARTPMRRLADPAEIARVIRFLASEDAGYITGQVLYADGGFLADYGVGPGPGS